MHDINASTGSTCNTGNAMAPNPGGKKFGWYHGWNIVVVCFFSGIASAALPINGFSLFLPYWSADLHVPISTLAIAMTGVGLATAVFAPLCGMATDRFSSRPVLVIGIVGLAIFYVAVSFITRAWLLLVIYTLVFGPAVLCCTAMPANAVLMRWFVRRLGLAIGITAMGVTIAGILMPPLVAALLPHFGWRLMWRAAGIFIAVVMLPAILLVVHERPRERDGKHYTAADDPQQAAAASSHPALRWRDILARRNFWLLAAAYLSLQALNTGAGFNLAVIAGAQGIGTQAAGFLLSAWSLTLTIATFAAGALSDRFGNRMPLVGLCLLTAAGGPVLAFGHSFEVLLVAALLIGVGGGYWPLLAKVLAEEYGTAGFGRAMGAMMLGLPLAGTSSFVVARVKESTGSYIPALLGFAALTLAGGVCAALLRAKRRGIATAGEPATII
jgi:MFS family permease